MEQENNNFIGSPLAFDSPEIWLARLENILGSIDKTRTEVVHQIFARQEGGFETTEAAALDNFEAKQFKWIKNMLDHMYDFGDTLVKTYTNRLLPPQWDVATQQTQPPTYLLRKVYHEMSNDLQLLQMSISQRVWDPMPRPGAESPTNQAYDQALNKIVTSYTAARSKYSEAQWIPVIASVVVNTAILEMGYRSTQSTNLLFADLLTREALSVGKPFLSAASDAPVGVITYFSEFMRVRILPYYKRMVLIGLPYSTGIRTIRESSDTAAKMAAEIPWEFLLLPHEVGHYLYWNGLTKIENGPVYIQGYLREKLEALKTLELAAQANSQDNTETSKDLDSDWRFAWSEEIFCDIYGCLVMGPIYLLGLQVVLSDLSEEEWFYDNGAHPIPAIRPYLASLILKLIHEKMNAKQSADIAARYNCPHAISQLDANWDALLSSWKLTEKLEAITVGHNPSQPAPRSSAGKWASHNYRSQPNQNKPEVEQFTFSRTEIETKLTPVINMMIDYLIHLPAEWEKEAEERKLYQQLPWSNDLKEGEGLKEMMQSLKDTFIRNVLGSKPISLNPDGEDINYADLVNYVDSKIENLQEDLIDGKDTNAIVQILEYYCNVWGDEGPTGSGVDAG